MEEVYKYVAVGNSGVGKSCLLLRFCDNDFTTSFSATIGIDFKIRTVELQSGKRVRIQIWDTAGQDRFRAITTAYYRGAQAALVVFDISNRDSFLSCNEWIRELRKGSPNAAIALVGNKCDAEDSRVVSANTAAAWAHAQNVVYYETSAKTGSNVTECIMALAERIQPRPQIVPLEPAIEKGTCGC
jgi:Ras-related protein Rab-8A